MKASLDGHGAIMTVASVGMQRDKQRTILLNFTTLKNVGHF